jgi:hypothetical protein
MKFKYLILIFLIFGCSYNQSNLINDKFIFDIKNELQANKEKSEVQDVQGKIAGKKIQKTNITISNISLPDFITLMFKEVFQRPFVMDRNIEKLNKRVDIEIRKDFSKDVFSSVITIIEKCGVDVEEVDGVLLFSVRADYDNNNSEQIGEGKGNNNQNKKNKIMSGSPADCIYYYVPVYSRALDLQKTLAQLVDSSKSIVIVNEANNSLICKTTLTEKKAIVKILRSLDSRQKQVAVDVTLAEVSLVDSFSGGLESFLTSNLFTLTANYDLKNGFALSGSVLLADVLKTVVSLGQKKGFIKVKSNPYLLVADGSTSSIEIGSEYPILTAIKSTAESTTQTQSVEYRKTGVILSINPVVSGDDIHLKSTVELSEGQKNESSSINSPAILSRKIKSEVVLRSGQSLVIGGLISDTQSKSNTNLKIVKLNEADLSTKTELVLIIRVQKIINDDSWFNRLLAKYENMELKK